MKPDFTHFVSVHCIVRCPLQTTIFHTSTVTVNARSTHQITLSFCVIHTEDSDCSVHQNTGVTSIDDTMEEQRPKLHIRCRLKKSKDKNTSGLKLSDICGIMGCEFLTSQCMTVCHIDFFNSGPQKHNLKQLTKMQLPVNLQYVHISFC
jgi:hypothetical protein